MGASLSEVAENAGVSTATASRALSGRRRVATDLVERVRASALELGYRPNAVASALRRQQTETIGFVVPQISNPFFPAIIEAVERALQPRGVELLLCDSQMSPEIEWRRVRALLSRQVDGLLISPVSYTDSGQTLTEAATSVPVVQIDRFVEGHSAAWVGLDDAAGIDQVVTHVAGRGATTTRFVSGGPNSSSGVLRLEAYRVANRRAGLRQAGRPLLGAFSREWGLKAAARMLDDGDPLPEAVICGNDEIALGVLAALHRAARSVPGDILVTGYDDIAMAELSDPPLTTSRQPREQIAQEAVRLLTESSARRVALAPELVVRESTGA